MIIKSIHAGETDLTHVGVLIRLSEEKQFIKYLWLELLGDILKPLAVQRCSEEKLFWKYAANLQENTHAEVWFQ